MVEAASEPVSRAVGMVAFEEAVFRLLPDVAAVENSISPGPTEMMVAV